jgi:hypothetical protein
VALAIALAFPIALLLLLLLHGIPAILLAATLIGPAWPARFSRAKQAERIVSRASRPNGLPPARSAAWMPISDRGAQEMWVTASGRRGGLRSVRARCTAAASAAPVSRGTPVGNDVGYLIGLAVAGWFSRHADLHAISTSLTAAAALLVAYSLLQLRTTTPTEAVSADAGLQVGQSVA